MNFYCGNAHASTSFFEYVKAGARVLKVSDHLLHVQLPPRVTCSFPLLILHFKLLSDFRKTILLRYLLLRHWVRTAPGNGLIFCNDINCTAIKIELCLQWQPCNHDVLNQIEGLSLRDGDNLTDERCTVVPSYPNNTNWLNNCCVGGI